VDGSDLHNIMT